MKYEEICRLVETTTLVAKELNVFYQDEILITAIEKLPVVFQVNYAAIFLYDEEDNTLILQHHNGDIPLGEKFFAMGKENVFGHSIERESLLCFENIEEYRKSEGLDFPDIDFYRCMNNYCCLAPLVIGKDKEKQIIGVLLLCDRKNSQNFEEIERCMIIQLGEILAHSLARTRLVEASIIADSSTDAFRWHPFYEYFAREVYRARRYQSPLSLILVDIDDLGSINKRHGIEGGDYVIQEGAKVIHRALRTVDIVSRKNDCFYIILPETKVTDAMIVAERLRNFFKERLFQYKSSKIIVRISLGVTECSSDDTPVSFMNKGKTSLDHAKERGGNQIVVYHIMQEALDNSKT